MTSPEPGDFDAAPVRSVTRPERWWRAGERANTAAEAAIERWRGLGGLRPRRGTVGCGIWSQTGRPWCPPPRVCSPRSRTREYVRASVSLFFTAAPSVRPSARPFAAHRVRPSVCACPFVRPLYVGQCAPTPPVTVLNFCPTPPSFSPNTCTGVHRVRRRWIYSERETKDYFSLLSRLAFTVFQRGGCSEIVLKRNKSPCQSSYAAGTGTFTFSTV